ncbi:hypothetical protein GCM10009792_14860 [Microcella alkalica]|uniref:Phage shock protein PspC (Stress-responsive transcriptional regulator) n=1 Tax=Microcella alkalica TaxID=355930 RepID=A0A839ECZ3_9MICO|nr:PspC domain-containing protein [Microcella alkalica]MBA8849076.1 phage shock protein PspC (stress-responsive transcriptional regulator) [Microcella alkalica]
MTDPTPPAGAPAAPPPPPPASGSSRFFSWLRSLNVTREPGWLGGVASGIALRLRIDPLIVRGILVVLAIFAFPVALLYALAWAILPDHTSKIHAEEVSRGRVEAGFVGAAVLLAIALLGLGDGGPWLWDGGYGWDGGWMLGSPGMAIAALVGLVWTVAVIGGIVWLIVWLVRRSRSTAATPAAGAASATFVAGAGTASAATAGATSADATATTPMPAADAPDGDLDAWRAQQSADRAQRDAFVSADEAARRQAEADRLAAERRARAAEYERQRQLRRRTRSHPLFTLAAIGLALIAGAVTTLTSGGTEIERGDVVLGFAVAIGALGLAIIINGVIGKRSGGSTGAAIIALVGLAIAGTSPGPGSDLRFVGSGEYAPLYTEDDDQAFVVGAGSTTVDLSDYWDGTRSGAGLEGVVSIVAGAGDVTVVLPESGAVEWAIVSGAGDATLVADGDARSIPRESGLDSPDGSDRLLTLEVVSGAGDILFTTEGTNR